MDRKTKIWIKAMDIGSRYWGCHQIPERSFFIFGWQFPICARCSGILAGELIRLGFIRVKPLTVRASLAMLLPLVIDGSIQFKSDYESNNIKRAITGCIFGYAFIDLLIKIINIIFKSFKNISRQNQINML